MVTSIQCGDLRQKLEYHPQDMRVWMEMQARALEGVLDSIPDQNQKKVYYKNLKLIKFNQNLTKSEIFRQTAVRQ